MTTWHQQNTGKHIPAYQYPAHLERTTQQPRRRRHGLLWGAGIALVVTAAVILALINLNPS